MSNEALKYISRVYAGVVHVCLYVCECTCVCRYRYGSQKPTLRAVLQELSAIYFGLYLLVYLLETMFCTEI